MKEKLTKWFDTVLYISFKIILAKCHWYVKFSFLKNMYWNLLTTTVSLILELFVLLGFMLKSVIKQWMNKHWNSLSVKSYSGITFME